MDWINQITTLKGETVELIPLEEKFFSQLDLLSKDQRIWEFIPVDMSDNEKRYTTFSNAIAEREKGTQYPFVIVHKGENKIIGATRLMDIQPHHKKLEIGWTWLHPNYWATEVNPECKLLLLTFCFEHLGASRVQLKTDENNRRSRKAIEKIGGRFEGILRHDMLRENGTRRNSAYYSIIDEEWESTKVNLTQLFKNKLNKL